MELVTNTIIWGCECFPRIWRQQVQYADYKSGKNKMGSLKHVAYWASGNTHLAVFVTMCWPIKRCFTTRMHTNTFITFYKLETIWWRGWTKRYMSWRKSAISSCKKMNTPFSCTGTQRKCAKDFCYSNSFHKIINLARSPGLWPLNRSVTILVCHSQHPK
jgi:hypothetical protein